MGKMLSFILALICAMVTFVGCSKESPYQSTEVENVSISISDISSTGATVIIQDLNEHPYVYGEWYKVEKEKNGEWYEVETVIENYGFNSFGYLAGENGEVKFTIDWEWLYGELPSGKYRILKEVDQQYISVTFDIE